MSPLTPAKQELVMQAMNRASLIARAICPGDEDAVSVAHLALVRAAAVWDEPGRRFKAEMSYERYALQCARFAVMRHRRKKADAKCAPLEWDPPAHTPDVDVDALISQLSPKDREIFVLKFVQRCSVTAISRYKRVNANKVYASLARSTTRLIELLEDTHAGIGTPCCM